ncbi:head-tail connector protein [Ligilactobacillus equi]|uniref:Uncharacterized protein n=1 Tax=Ligilactobacillus equi DSM 15833 = JCM 10991 TaxID=1423740 RepID=A0A0R1T5J2_9LACO|nr:head-tail connector protein [Ligilactobacillus equi]KRL76620.1 hypothetical protein FC36_GL001858 [Ligilactobacillus equi DSM 15833 = JCM 10991]
MLLTEERFSTLKNYCKIDQDFDDDVLKELVNASAMELARAIKFDSQPSDYIDDSRFFIALMKMVKEDYYLRGLSADNYRPELSNNIVSIINQLRSELDADE